MRRSVVAGAVVLCLATAAAKGAAQSASAQSAYRMALQAGLHKNLSEVLIPGVLKSYDTPDLLTALHPRSVVLVSPANALGQPAREAVVRTELAAAFDTDQRLGTPNRIRLMRRDARDPLPID